eukprot:TRINITY_DN18012_c0_g1_i1.p1 TRINITY_DN18012_c0_g1~~TRINITY_DN18012_c0_g1_i1.p1  ORF type:complete len:587 (+),score=173.98 TRINITY_DN18012_c0_g1_i1:91-1851(+)
MLRSLVGSEMCIRDRVSTQSTGTTTGPMGALQSLITSKLNDVLGDYFEGIDSSQLATSISAGTLELRNLTARTDAFKKFGLPVGVKKGRLGYLKLTIPWAHIKTQPVQVEVEDLYLVCRKEDWSNHGQAARELAMKLWRVDSAGDSLKMKLSALYGDTKQEEEDGWSDKLIARVIDNLEISIKRIHIRFEDTSLFVLDDAPATPFCLGIHVSSLNMYTTDEHGNKIFTTNQNTVVKSLELTGLGVYCNALTDHVSTWNVNVDNWDQFLVDMTESIAGGSHSKHHYLISPADCSMKWTQRKAGAAAGEPKNHVMMQTSKVELHVAAQQLWALLSMFEYTEYFRRWDQYRNGTGYQDLVERGFSPNRMWRHAIGAVRSEIALKSAPLDPESVTTRRRTRLVYQQLFREFMHAKDPNDLPWLKNQMSSGARSQFHQLRKQLSTHELIAYEGAEMARVFAEKRKYWEEWHAANDGLRFYQSAVVIHGVTLTADEEAEVKQQCGDMLMSESSDNAYLLKFDLATPSLEVVVSNQSQQRLLHAKCRTICLLYTSDAADEEDSVDLGGRRIIKKKKKIEYEYARFAEKTHETT